VLVTVPVGPATLVVRPAQSYPKVTVPSVPSVRVATLPKPATSLT
jgi:hypothetical protein